MTHRIIRPIEIAAGGSPCLGYGQRRSITEIEALPIANHIGNRYVAGCEVVGHLEANGVAERVERTDAVALRVYLQGDAFLYGQRSQVQCMGVGGGNGDVAVLSNNVGRVSCGSAGSGVGLYDRLDLVVKLGSIDRVRDDPVHSQNTGDRVEVDLHSSAGCRCRRGHDHGSACGIGDFDELQIARDHIGYIDVIQRDPVGDIQCKRVRDGEIRPGGGLIFMYDGRLAQQLHGGDYLLRLLCAMDGRINAGVVFRILAESEDGLGQQIDRHTQFRI